MTEITQAIVTSPLEGANAVNGAVSLHEMPLSGKLVLRGELSDSAFVAACEQILGAAPQSNLAPPQTLSAGTLYWMGPNEWVLHCSLEAVGDLIAAFEVARSNAHLSAVDVSDYYVVIRLAGEASRAVLSRGTPLDMHASQFKVGDATPTRFAKCSVLLHAQDVNTFDLQVRWSHAKYLWQYLAQAASQYN